MKLFKLTSTTSKLEINLEHPINLKSDKNYSLGLNGFYSDNFICNFISTDNSAIQISHNNNKFYLNYPLYEGYYSLEDLKKEFIIKIKSYKDTNKLNINENDFILTTKNNKIMIKSPLEIDLSISLANMLGLNKNVEKDKEIEGKDVPKFRSFDVIEIHCNIIEPSIENHNILHKESEILYSFYPNVEYGSKISEKPYKIDFIPIRKNINQIKNIIITIQDGNGNILNNPDVNNIVYLRLKSN